MQIKWDSTPVAAFQEKYGTAVLNFPNILEIAEYLPHARFSKKQADEKIETLPSKSSY